MAEDLKGHGGQASNHDGNPGNMSENRGVGVQRSSNRGFAAMDPQLQREIASKGGKAAHAQGTAHEFSSEEAREAGRKGGQASGGNKAKARMENKY